MDLIKAENYVRNLLPAGLPTYMHYHNLDHTLDVLHAATSLAGEEGISGSELVMLQTAALFHDIGFVRMYENHENESCSIAKEVLPGCGYNSMEIEKVCSLIIKTKMHEIPMTLSEKILRDADLDYLGRDDFEKTGNKLFREWLEIGFVKDDREWNEKQVTFLESHHYWTASAAKKRDAEKQKHLDDLKKSLV